MQVVFEHSSQEMHANPLLFTIKLFFITFYHHQRTPFTIAPDKQLSVVEASSWTLCYKIWSWDAMFIFGGKIKNLSKARIFMYHELPSLTSCWSWKRIMFCADIEGECQILFQIMLPIFSWEHACNLLLINSIRFIKIRFYLKKKTTGKWKFNDVKWVIVFS